MTEEQVDSGLKEIRLALLEADVALQVVKDFIENVKPKAIGQEIIKSTSPGQMIVKIVYDELVNILGSKNEEINLKAVPPISLLLVGLQGSGKTTSAAKLDCRHVYHYGKYGNHLYLFTNFYNHFICNVFQ